MMLLEDMKAFAKELRLGNLIYILGRDFDESGPFVDSSCKDEHEVNLGTFDDLLNFDYTAKHDCYEPIPITPEWLERLGFQHEVVYPGEDWFKIGKRSFMLDCESDHGKIEYYSLHGIMDYSIMYIHQLQNLYFALTGQELTVKQPETI